MRQPGSRRPDGAATARPRATVRPGATGGDVRSIAGPGAPDRGGRAASLPTAPPPDPASRGRIRGYPYPGGGAVRRSWAILRPRFRPKGPDSAVSRGRRPARALCGPVRASGPRGGYPGRGRGVSSRPGGEAPRIRRNPGRTGSGISHRSTSTPSQPALQPATTAPRPRRTHARSRSPPHWQGPRHSPRLVRFHPSVASAAVRMRSHVQSLRRVMPGTPGESSIRRTIPARFAPAKRADAAHRTASGRNPHKPVGGFLHPLVSLATAARLVGPQAQEVNGTRHPA